jgi:hypothetical protein
MSITINGSGTVTGISAGGLPDDCITTADIAANAVTTAKLGSAEQSGLCKAWANFNGTGTPAIRASFNVSSITDNGTGDYTVNFTTALADANYAAVGTVGIGSGETRRDNNCICYSRSSSSASFRAGASTDVALDFDYVAAAIFR